MGGPGPESALFRMDPAKLRDLRRKMFLSQSEFQRKFGLDIREVESGKGRKYGHRGNTVRRYAEAFGVDPGDLLVEDPG